LRPSGDDDNCLSLKLEANRADVTGVVDLGVVENRDPHPLSELINGPTR
jgi:hypothetical protein